MAATKRPSGGDTDASRNLADLIEQHENTDWSDVPGVSTAEAAAWTQRLIEARGRVQGGQ